METVGILVSVSTYIGGTLAATDLSDFLLMAFTPCSIWYSISNIYLRASIPVHS
jgi:hypothetical protein